MNAHHNINYTKDDINKILLRFQECVNTSRYTISLNKLNRIDNHNFILRFGLDTLKRKSILSQIKVDDFIHSVKNINSNFPDNDLYVFVRQVSLYDNIDNCEIDVNVYIKLVFNECDKKYVVVVSFHEAKKHFDYLFK